MRKGGLHKPLILDKFSAEDLDTGAMDNKTQGAKSGTCQYVLNRPDSSRDPAGQILSTRCEGKSSKIAEFLKLLHERNCQGCMRKRKGKER